MPCSVFNYFEGYKTLNAQLVYDNIDERSRVGADEIAKITHQTPVNIIQQMLESQAQVEGRIVSVKLIATYKVKPDYWLFVVVTTDRNETSWFIVELDSNEKVKKVT